MVHSRPRAFRRPLASIRALAWLAACGAAASGAISPASPQTPDPVTLSLFDPDFADLAAAAVEKLKEATNCYPSATFIIGAPGTDDLMRDALAKARKEALHAALTRLGLDATRFEIKIEIEPGAKKSDDIQVNYPRSKTDGDKEGPKLKVTSEPKKNTKVKVGDKIKVTITASERYEDGHKSWPTGVRSIQLLADDGKIDPDSDFGMRPPPCERRTVVITYTVPSSPPPIVHLKVLAEDAVGNPSTESAEFPTVDVWTGQLSRDKVQTIHNDEHMYDYHWSVKGRFTFHVGADEIVVGAGEATFAADMQDQVFAELSASHSGKLPPTNVPIVVAGRRVGANFELNFRPSAPAPIAMATVSRTKNGHSVSYSLEPFKNIIYYATLPAEDGAIVNRSDIPDRTFVMTTHVELHLPNQNDR